MQALAWKETNNITKKVPLQKKGSNAKKRKKGLQRHKKKNTQHLIHKRRRRLHQAPLPLNNQSKTERDRAEGARPEKDRTEGARPERDRAKGARPERARAEGARPERDRARTERDCVEGARTEKDRAKGARKRDGARDETTRGMGTARGTEIVTRGMEKVAQERRNEESGAGKKMVRRKRGWHRDKGIVAPGEMVGPRNNGGIARNGGFARRKGGPRKMEERCKERMVPRGTLQ